MSALRPRNRSRQKVAVAVLGAVLLLLGALAVVPHIWSLHLTRQIDKQGQTLVRLERDASRMSASKQRLAIFSDQGLAAGLLLEGNTAGLNGARLQRRVADMAARSGIALQSLQVSGPESWKPSLRSVRLVIGLRAPLAQIQALLHDIETAHPLMFIDALTLARPVQTERSTGEQPLDAWLTVRGIALEGTANGT